ncbi:hypothetical protein BDV95DRAFT_354359 [Massariosphaeria phaeospora]|uniref:F-box domain-containing protein n=1 Tax=Massariosphaeria phaeospora TaxID=100035 RepID=A0A7C8I990_9PLEO|nr:hypothetical protein BDV95DRAFT_354359 [Massariosphaeria phaeospora]
MFFQFPLELQQQCVQSLDVATLKSFRTVSKRALPLATEVLFDTVNLLPTNASAAKYSHILNNAQLNPLVRRAIFNTSDPAVLDRRGDPEFLDSFKDAMCSMTRFRHLKNVELKFAGACGRHGPWAFLVLESNVFRVCVLKAFFAGLEPIIQLESLTIKNLQVGTHESVYNWDSFQSVISKVKRLHLQIASETLNHQGRYREFRHAQHFFQADLAPRWLQPTHAQLTHLTLYAGQMKWGFWPSCDLRSIHFPALKSLALGNWTIVHEWQIEWLLSHGSTLVELVPDDCPIVTALMMNDQQITLHWPDLPNLCQRGGGHYFKEVALRWHHALPRFQSALPRLCYFAMGRGDWVAQTMFEDRYDMLTRCHWGRYCMFDRGKLTPGDGVAPRSGDSSKGPPIRKLRFEIGDPNDWKEDVAFPTCDEEDTEALASLLASVEKRARAKV